MIWPRLQILRQFETQKVTAPPYVMFAWTIDEVAGLLLPGLLLLMLLFALRRHLTKRIEERRFAWEYFMNRVMALEYMIGAEKQADKASNQL